MSVSAPHFFFTPLNRHTDYGFGATAESFKEAADQLIKESESRRQINLHLPTKFVVVGEALRR